MELAGFIAVVLLAYLISGPDFLLVSRYAVQLKQLGFTTALGAQSSLCLHMLMAAMGFSAIARKLQIFLVIRWIGAAYLIWLGITVLRKSEQHPIAQDEVQCEDACTGRRRASASGFLTNVLNPKAIVFFLAYYLNSWIQPLMSCVRF